MAAATVLYHGGKKLGVVYKQNSKLLTRFGTFIIRLRKISSKLILPINLLILFKLLAKRSSANFEHEKITECVRSSVSILVFLLQSDLVNSANTLDGEYSISDT
jgi:hypothetical protein